MHECAKEPVDMILTESSELLDDASTSDSDTIYRYRTLKNGTSEKLIAKDNVASVTTLPAGITKRSFVTDFKIADAFWCTFPADEECHRHSSMLCICLVGEENLQFCPDLDGHIYSITLPFKMSRAFPSEFGLVLQRRPAASSSHTPTVFPFLFSLSHPYDEILPVIYKAKDVEGSSHYAWDIDEISVVSVLPQAKLVLCYSQANKTHSLCCMRKVTKTEWKCAAYNAESVVSFASMRTPTARSFLAATPQLSVPPSSKIRSGLADDALDLAESTPLRSVRTRSMTAAAALIESVPFPVISPAQRGSASRSVRDVSSCRLRRTSIHSTPRLNTYCDDSIVTAIDLRGSEIDMIAPEVCIESIWTEAVRRGQECTANAPASRVFLTQDFTEQLLLCFFVECQSVLKCIRVNSLDGETYTSGSIIPIPCRSATNLPGFEVMVLVELDGVPALYTGIQRLGELYGQNSLRLSALFSEPGFTGKNASTVFRCGPAVSVSAAQNGSCILETSERSFRLCKIFSTSVSSFIFECLRCIASAIPKDKALKLFTSWYLGDHNRLLRHYDGDCVVMEVSMFLQFIFVQMGLCIHKFPLFEEVDQLRRLRDEGGIDVKKQRTVAERSVAWERMTASDSVSTSDVESRYSVVISETGFICPYSFLIFGALHSCYENAKLDCRLNRILRIFASALHAFASIYELSSYVEFYIVDNPELGSKKFDTVRNPESGSASPTSLVANRVLPEAVPSFHETFTRIFTSNLQPAFANSDCLCALSLLVAIGLNRVRNISDVQKMFGRTWERKLGLEKERVKRMNELLDSSYSSVAKKCESYARLLGITRDTLLDLPSSLSLIVCELLYCHGTRSLNYFKIAPQALFRHSLPDGEELEKVVRLRWKSDLRCNNILQMLNSQRPTFLPSFAESTVDVMSDSDLRERQEHLLFAVCTRTVAQCFGRGMTDFRHMVPPLSRTLAVPPLCLMGRSHPANMAIELPQSESTKAMNEWGSFYNAVAAGLALGSSEHVWLDCEWLSMSASKQSSAVCAGLLYAFGLNGHIASMNLYKIHELLSGDDRLTSVAILLGYAVNKRATSEMQIYKMMVTHLPFLMGPTLLELHIDPMVQTAALVSLGLLFAGSSHLGILGQLVNEIARPAIPDQEPLTDRYSYTLAAGFAIGLISLGRGEELCSNHPFEERIPSLANRLLVLMKGGPRSSCYFPTTLREPVSFSLNNTLTPQLSNHFRETENVNPHLTASAATIAFGLMYLRTGDKFAANYLQLPTTLWEIEEIRPDVLLLRTLSRLLILWDEICPSQKWVEKIVPENILLHKKRLFNCSNAKFSNDLRYVVDPETIAQTYLAVVSGACFAIALRFASTCNSAAFEVITFYLSLVIPDGTRSDPAKELCSAAGRYICALALNTILHSLGILMAGSGNLQVIRICTYLRGKVTVKDAHRDALAHSTQVAVHMTLGLLSVGHARYALSTSDLSIAALVIAFFPVCPQGISDNRMYLQPLRYLWTIAAEERIITPVCAVSQKFLEADILLTFKETRATKRSVVRMKAPCILPELHLLDKVQIECPGYETRVFNVKIMDDANNLREIILMKHGKLQMSSSGKNGVGIVLSATQRVLKGDDNPDEVSEDLEQMGTNELPLIEQLSLKNTTFPSNGRQKKDFLWSPDRMDDYKLRINHFHSDRGSLAAFDFHFAFVKDASSVDCRRRNRFLQEVLKFLDSRRNSFNDDFLGCISLDVVQSLKSPSAKS